MYFCSLLPRVTIFLSFFEHPALPPPRSRNSPWGGNLGRRATKTRGEEIWRDNDTTTHGGEIWGNFEGGQSPYRLWLTASGARQLRSSSPCRAPGYHLLVGEGACGDVQSPHHLSSSFNTTKNLARKLLYSLNHVFKRVLIED